MKKLITITAAILMTLMSLKAQEGEIIFRDFEPDLYVGALTYPFPLDTLKVDIDQDETTDFELYIGIPSPALGISALWQTRNGWYYRLKTTEADSIISFDGTWFNPDRPQMFTFYDNSPIMGMMGFRKIVDGKKYYAWMTIYVTREIYGINGVYDKVQAYVDNVAYCTIPDYPLRWGQTSLNSIGLEGSEWYYEILNDDGSITYQHLECVGDTLFDQAGKRPKIIVRSNTHYDRDQTTEVTHEYVYEENGIVYWWNKDLEEFTTLYNLYANVDDEWEIKVGNESITMHVDAVENYDYGGQTHRMLHVSDSANIFSGNILCSIGHLTSFFPEKLMNQGKGFRVDGLRCYWVEDALLYHNGDEDCDAIHSELQGVEEEGTSMGFGTLTVYPNPANGVLFVETRHGTSLPDQTYRITNLVGQTLLQGTITAETQQIDIANLPAGMYFISVGEQTVKFVKP